MPGSDAAAISRSLDDPEEFSMVYERHHDTIFRYVARRVGVAEAADVTSEVFLRAFRNRGRFDTSRESCLPWMYGIATNVIGDQLRQTRRRQRKYLALVGLNPSPSHAFDDADDHMVAAAVSGELDQALGALRKVDRDVLLLFAVEGLEYRQIAEALEIPIGTVRSRLSRARSKLRELIPGLAQTAL
jgi:RNA polymerase sigma-70 factor (ECF subfamily)